MPDLSGIGGGISSIFSGIGSLESAGGYREAAKLSRQNADIEKLSTGIKLTQQNRQAYQVIGATEAATAGNGLSLSGSAMDTLRSNAQQISLNKTLVNEQGQIDINSWLEKSSSDEAAAAAATAGGIGGIIGGVLGLFSDLRLKDIIRRIGEVQPGIGLYEFRFKGKPNIIKGVIAQEVQMVRPELVGTRDGYLTVRYDLLGLDGYGADMSGAV